MCDLPLTAPVYSSSVYTSCPRSTLNAAPGTQDKTCKENHSKQAVTPRISAEGGVKKKKITQGGKRKKDKLRKGISWRHSSRSRRLIANARERSRIHIMSEAFECLRKAVPSYSHDQKLSKLAILRLATSYISALGHLAENDTSTKSLKHFADCVDQCTRALQAEGRAKRKEGRKNNAMVGSEIS